MMHKWKIIVASSSEAFDVSKLERRVKPGAPLSIGVIHFYKTLRGTTPIVRCVIKYLKDHGYQGVRLILTNSLNGHLFHMTKETSWRNSQRLMLKTLKPCLH